MSEFDIPSGFHGAARNNKNTGLKITDGDTIQVNQAIRMLNIDTPEKAGGSFGKAASAQAKLARAKQRIDSGQFDGLLTDGLQQHLAEKLTSTAAKRHFRAGNKATKVLVRSMRKRIGSFTDDLQPRLFIRSYEPYFDSYTRMLAFAAPLYLKEDLPELGDPARNTFNLELLETGHAVHFPIYPSIPKSIDWNMAVTASKNAWDNKLGQWADNSGGPDVLLAYEFRAALDLGMPVLKATKRGKKTKTWFEEKLNEGLAQRDALIAKGWTVSDISYEHMVKEAFSRHCIDILTWQYVGVQEYHTVEPWARLWVWDSDLIKAKADLGID